MSKKTKTFKIGEYSYYGKWRISINGTKITVQGIEWKSGEVKEERTFSTSSGNDLPMYLTEMTTPYHSDKMMDWIKTQVEYKTPGLVQGLWGPD